MNSKIIIGVIAIVLVAVGVYTFSSMKGNDAMKKEIASEQMMKNDESVDRDRVMMEDGVVKSDTMMKDGVSDTMMKKIGTYEVYSGDKIMRASQGKVVLFFRAVWCPTCKTLDADIRAHLKDIPESVTILDVDYDTYADLKKKYGVTYQHTLVQVDASGNQIVKWSGGSTLVELLSHIK